MYVCLNVYIALNLLPPYPHIITDKFQTHTHTYIYMFIEKIYIHNTHIIYIYIYIPINKDSYNVRPPR